MFQAFLASPLFLFVAVLVVVLLGLWFRTRDRRWGTAAGLAIAGMAAYFLFLQLRGETVAQQMERKLDAMAEALKRRDVPGIFAHVSDDFYLGPLNKESLQGYARRYLDSREITSLEIWKFRDAEVHAVPAGETPTAKITCNMKPKGQDIPNHPGFRCDAEFVRDADGEWRLLTFKLYRFGSKDEYPIPYLPIQ